MQFVTIGYDSKLIVFRLKKRAMLFIGLQNVSFETCNP